MSNPLQEQEGGTHYKDMAIQPMEIALANKLNAAEFNVLKYTMRKKGGKAKRLEDLRKAMHCLQILTYSVESDTCE